MSDHLPQEATHENEWASWRCIDCGQNCPSSNPCDCCADAPDLLPEPERAEQ